MTRFSAMKFAGGVSSALVALALSSAPAAALTKEEIALLNTPDRTAILIEGAKKEGEIVWYSTMVADQVTKPINDAFMKKYPFIKGTYIASASASIYQRALAESRAKNVKVDVMAAGAADTFRGTNVTQPFYSPELAAYPKEFVDPDRLWASFRTTWTAVVWNSKLVPEPPKSWEDLAHPRFKGKLAWSDLVASGAPRIITHFRAMWGEDKALEFLKKLQAQGIRTAPGDTGLLNAQLSAGEYPIIVGQALALVALEKAKGAPIDGANLEPSITRTSAVAMLRDPPNPHAAALFMDWLLSKDGGQQILADVGYNPAHPEVPALEALRWIVPATTGMKELVLSTEQENQMAEKSAELYRTMFK
jgi:ABC-type Fe3+ transport system substrate-binding protein